MQKVTRPKSLAALFLLPLALSGALWSDACAQPAQQMQPGRGLRGGGDRAAAIKALLGSRKGNAPVPANVVYEEWLNTKSNRKLPVKIYLPTVGQAPYPLVIFSHGLGGSREAAPYLGDYWSHHGFLCIFVQHPGSDTSVVQAGLGGGKEGLMATMKEAANGPNLLDRAFDVHFVIDEVERRIHTDPKLKGQVQLSKIAVAGHSFGAGTALAIAGQNFPVGKFADDRVKAAIYLCPPVIGAGSFVPEQRYGGIHIPGLLMTGTEDTSAIGGTRAEDRRIPYDGMTAPHQYLVNFQGADHAVFGGRSFRTPAANDVKFQQMIAEVTTKFLDATLNNDQAAAKWLDNGGAAKYLGSAAVFEHK
ncbi:MAG: alpha/beta fold hydrolase [Cyanobacteria bacterium SZAS LIN-2]|nr:alpha/beta fold hydrolase [Cyanobacteria bacterium SZAS LIN-2]